jgi:tRNA 2-thiouridine synthesizing protein A
MQYSTRVEPTSICRRRIHPLDDIPGLKFAKSCNSERSVKRHNDKEYPPLSSEQASVAGIGHHADAQVDARGHRCPMPLLMAKRGQNGLETGQTLHLISTDAGSRRDFEIFAKQSGHELLQAVDVDDEFHFLLRKT